MFTINEEEKAKAKYLADRLMPLGGFICEEAAAKLLSQYPKNVVNIARDYCYYSKDFFHVMEKLEAITKEIMASGTSEGDMISRMLRIDEDFDEWLMRQIIKAEMEEVKNPDSAIEWLPDSLSALEKKLLKLFIEQKMGLKELKECLECEGEEEDEYIILLLHYIVRKLKSKNCILEELDERLKEEKLALDW